MGKHNEIHSNVLEDLNSKLVKLNTKLVVCGVCHCRSCLRWTSALWFLFGPRFSRDGSMPILWEKKPQLSKFVYSRVLKTCLQRNFFGVWYMYIMKNVLRYQELEKRFYILIDKKRRFFLYQSSFNNNTKFILKLYYYLSAKDWNLKFKNI